MAGTPDGADFDYYGEPLEPLTREAIEASLADDPDWAIDDLWLLPDGREVGFLNGQYYLDGNWKQPPVPIEEIPQSIRDLDQRWRQEHRLHRPED